MKTNEPTIYLERIDAKSNMARFYHLFAQIDLFGTIVAVRRWGRIGRSGREITWQCSSISEAAEQLEHFASVKRRRGYCDVHPDDRVAANSEWAEKG
jgi:predicted DNA-binding WGR domain protein